MSSTSTGDTAGEMAAGVGVTAVVDEGLGNSCYLLDLGDGSALVVDPPRDLRAVRAAAEKGGVRIRFAADTRLHADFRGPVRTAVPGRGQHPPGQLPGSLSWVAAALSAACGLVVAARMYETHHPQQATNSRRPQ